MLIIGDGRGGDPRIIRIHRDLVLCNVADETFDARDQHIRRDHLVLLPWSLAMISTR